MATAHRGQVVNAPRTAARTVSVLIAACAVTAAASQTVTYLAPEKHTAAVADRVAVYVTIGDGSTVQQAAWPDEKIDWLFVRAAGTQTNRQDVGPAEPNGRFINVPMTRPGVTLIGIDIKPTVEHVRGQQLKEFLRRTTSPRPREDRVPAIADDARVRVRRIESAKTLVRVLAPDGKPRSHSAIAQSKTGQAVEIRPLADPTMVAVGSDLPLRVYTQGGSPPGLRVLATCVTTDQTQEAVTDPSGTCHFRITDTGMWRIEFHHAEPLRSDPHADWAICSATLTFEVTLTGEAE